MKQFQVPLAESLHCSVLITSQFTQWWFTIAANQSSAKANMTYPGINENESACSKRMERRCPFKNKKKLEGKPIACHTMTFPLFIISISTAEWEGLFVCNWGVGGRGEFSLHSHSGDFYIHVFII